MKKSAERGVLKAFNVHLYDGVTWFFSPYEVIYWAVRHGIYFPEDLQKLTVNLINVEKGKPLQNKVKNKIVAQLLLYENPIRSVKELAESDLIREFGTGKEDRDPTAIVRAINELYDKKGKSGESLRPKYIPKAIPELKRKDKDGIIRFHFPSIRIALRTLMYCWIYRLGNGNLIEGVDNALKAPQNIIPENFLNLEIVKLYLVDSPPIIKLLSVEVCVNHWEMLRGIQTKDYF